MFELNSEECVLVIGFQIEADIEMFFFGFETAPTFLQLVTEHAYIQIEYSKTSNKTASN